MHIASTVIAINTAAPELVFLIVERTATPEHIFLIVERTATTMPRSIAIAITFAKQPVSVVAFASPELLIAFSKVVPSYTLVVVAAAVELGSHLDA